MSQKGAHVKPKEPRRPKPDKEEPKTLQAESGQDREMRSSRPPRDGEGEPAAPRNDDRRGDSAPRGQRPGRARSAGAGAAPPRKKKKKKKNRTALIVVIVVIAVIVAVIAAAVGIFLHLYGLMNSERETPATAGPTAGVPQTPEFTPEPTPSPSPTPEPLTEEEIQALEEMELRNSLQEDAEEIVYSDDVYNILLLGADGRTETLERSDAMLLLSINKATETIWLTSFMRDTQVTLMNPDGSIWGTGHLNWATSAGGVDMLVATIESEKNFAIHIDNWALVDFVDFAEVAELVAPVHVTVTPEEVEDMNLLVRESCRIYDKAYGLEGTENTRYRAYFPTGGGEFDLTDGIQILAYCRERHIGGDTGRSQKQRDVLTQMWENVKKMSLTEQYNLAEEVMKIIKTDLTAGKCASLLLSAPSLLGYEIHTQQCPTPGAFWKGRDNDGLSAYFADFAVNRNFLRASIYGDEMTRAELTSSWTGESIYVYDPENNTYWDPVTYSMH